MIAIKMDMPESCVECKLSRVTGGKNPCLNCIMIRGVDEIDWTHERHKDCPLIELDRRLEADINVYQWICKLEKKKYE